LFVIDINFVGVPIFIFSGKKITDDLQFAIGLLFGQMLMFGHQSAAQNPVLFARFQTKEPKVI
jgi:hypothetical protein